jgi:hypothetical protein
MSTETRRTENGTEKRTVRACEQSMTVVPHGDGTGMFNIYSGESPEPYVVDLAGEHDRCTCPDVQHNLEVGERCKHSRRVRLELGLAPFEDVPQVREEHAALTDVELARRQRGIDIKPEPEPEPITVSDAKPARAVATDGGEELRFCSKGCLETYEQQLAAQGNWRNELTSWGGWYRLGNQYRKEWSMIYKDVVLGFLIAGFVIVFVPQWVWDALFMQGDGVLVSAQNAVMGVTIAVISFVGSIGNVPFAAALWFSGGIGFAGVIAFIYSDLITIPVLNVFRKYYGWHVMLYILGVFSPRWH